MTFKPRLPDDVRYAPTPAGVAFLTGDGVVQLNGRSIHQWVDRLAAHLDGAVTLEELTAGMPDDRRAFVTGLITALRERGIVEDASTPSTLRIRKGTIGALLTDDERCAALTDALAEAMRRLGLDVWRGPSGSFVGEAGVHVAAADEAGLRAAERLDAAGIAVTHVLVGEGEVWWGAGPLAPGWRRLQAMRPPEPPSDPCLSQVAATVIAGQVVADLGRGLTGTPGGSRVLRAVDLATLSTRSHAYLPHPATRPAGEGTLGEPMGEEEFSRRAASLMDDRTGVFTALDEGPFGQLPLHVSAATVADPMGLLGSDRIQVLGVGPDFATSRYRAALRALTAHALLALDPRRLTDGHVRGRDLADGSTVLLPADRVFALTPQRTLPPGAAAAYSTPDALLAGLLSLCAGLARFDRPLPAVTVPGPSRSLTLLESYGRPYGIVDASGETGVPILAGTLDGRLVTCAAGTTPAEAAEAVLEGILRAHQGIPQDVPVLELDVQVDGETPLGTARVEAADLVAALARAGRRPAVVMLDHDPEVHALMPHVIRVVTEPADA
ncbi:hypothetical protein [Nonomuraea sediminis]|uniref:hypothetical protein n=1 Tax=Nonomuraea sediminis TaxID=2835864 RepID=UPI001BDBF89D|nr:hypothetical protein [Nonomuraea sediminis]